MTSSAQPVSAPTTLTVSPSGPTPSPNTPRQVRWVWYAAGGAAIAVVFFGIFWFSYRFTHSINEDAFVEAHIVNVAPEMVSGRIVRFLVEENDQGEQGQVLVEIETVHYRDQVEQARGKLELAEAEVKRQEAGLAKLAKEGPLQIDVANDSIEEAQAAV